MANEQSSSDITERTFATLTEYDNADAEVDPVAGQIVGDGA